MITKEAIFDTHFHLYEEDNKQHIISEALKKNVQLLMNIGTDLNSSMEAQKVADSFKNVYFSAGVHPCYIDNFNNNYTDFESLFQHPRCLAIGEIGLDYHYPHDKNQQKKVFSQFLQLAYKLKKPAIIHCRDAFDDCIKILKTSLKNESPFILHCYTGDTEWAKKIIEIGGYISYSGIITFKNNTQKIRDSLTAIPLNRILIETDSPYLAPTPYRGKRNQPAYIIHTLEKMAQILGMSLDETALLTRQNACNLLGIKYAI